MILETSRAMGSGKRVPLRFDTNVRVREARKGAQGAGFFPGAIVALKGRNGSGEWFLVTEILAVSRDQLLVFSSLIVARRFRHSHHQPRQAPVWMDHSRCASRLARIQPIATSSTTRGTHL